MLHKNTLIIFFILTITANTFAQNSTAATGEWILDQIAENGQYKSLGQLVDFNQDGKLYIQEFPFGTWSFNQEDNTLVMDAEDLSGSYELAYLSATNMQLTLDDKDLYFTKIDREKIIKDNATSGLIGLWEYANDLGDNTRRLIQFKAPNKVSLIEKDDTMESRYSGIWFYQVTLNQLIIIGQLKGVRGINTEVTITPNEINLLNKKTPTILKKVKQDTTSLEHLNFTEDDFYDAKGDYKYENDEQKLPWKDYYQMIDELSSVKQLVYKEATLVSGTKSFENKILKTDVKANLDNELLEIDNVFNGYDRYHLPNDTKLKSNKYDSYTSKLYPYKEITFRVENTSEKVTVPAGIYTCTVVEGLGDFEEKVKIWMINDKPGVIAKIIKEKTGSFGHYITYELQAIKTN